MVSKPAIGIAGAGSIGCFVGGMLAAGGHRVALLARPRIIVEIEASGLRPTSFEGFDQTVPRASFVLSENPSVFEAARIVLVTVKSADTAAMAEVIAKHAPSDAIIVSLQNGVGNKVVLRERLPGRRVLGGMVPFNVIALGKGRFHRATSGDIVIEQDEARTAEGLSVPGLKMRATGNIEGVQWGKLVLNLNNALNALADLPLRQQIGLRPWRRLFADQVAEALAAIKAEGIRPVSPTPIPFAWLPSLLRLPVHLRGAARTDHEDRSRGALVDVGRFAAPTAHRGRLSAGRHHRNGRAPRPGGAAVAPDRGIDPAGRARGQGIARPDAGTDTRGLSDALAVNCRWSGRALEWAREERRMKRTYLALIAIALAGSVSTAAHAVPPTATPSPGYEARLQEQRAASRAAVAPVVKPRRVKRVRAH